MNKLPESGSAGKWCVVSLPHHFTASNGHIGYADKAWWCGGNVRWSTRRCETFASRADAEAMLARVREEQRGGATTAPHLQVERAPQW